MIVFTKQMIIPFLALLLACNSNKDKQEAKVLNRYKDTPAFIKSFLDAKHDGKFLIAEPGKDWSGGCVGEAGIPRYQFNRAFFDSTEYKMEFWAGGIAGPHLDTMVLGLQNNQVVSYSIGNYHYKVE